MIRYIDKGTARQHLIDRLMESALNNVGSRADVDAVFLDIAKNRLPVWLDEVETYDVAEVKRGRWIVKDKGIIVTSYCCSECGRVVRDDTGYDVAIDYPYCHCGAKMESEE